MSQSKALKQNDSIMGTNDSSIVSKRSVERLYYPDEAHFFRYFVKKPQRRAPLINRGYWLRMKAIDYVVHQFLMELSDIPKVVINLGCGYDPYPWQCLARYPEACQNVKFIDVDYMPLMVKKRAIIKDTVELNSMLTNLSYSSDGGHVILRSDQYAQVGCDLRQLQSLASSLASLVDMQECLVLCTAEVSITYMQTEAADKLIEWVCSLPNFRFCLLEQILPDGPDHPFAKTMLAHFEKLQTPLHAARTYPTIRDQTGRFKEAGWANIWALNLWQLWSSPDFLTPDQRATLNGIEPFDEWEELALFGYHYVLLVASNDANSNKPPRLQESSNKKLSAKVEKARTARVTYSKYEKSCGYRRFAAPLLLRSSNRQRDLVGNFAGMGVNSRLNSYDVYKPLGSSERLFNNRSSPESPSARVCHTITDLGDAGALLVGGRASPDNGLADCWLYHKLTSLWERVDDLPTPRYRHSAVLIGNDSVLIAGGKTDSQTILEDFILWNRHRGWVKCICDGQDSKILANDKRRPVVFGAVLQIRGTNHWRNNKICGIFAGGISPDGIISQTEWIWTLRGYQGLEPSISFEESDDESPIARFGASIIRYDNKLLLLGGIAPDGILAMDNEIVVKNLSEGADETLEALVESVHLNYPGPRPLLVGASIVQIDNILISMGGGAVCFSFGTFWNTGSFSIRLEGDLEPGLKRDRRDVSMEHTITGWGYSETYDMVLHGNLSKPQHSRLTTNEPLKILDIITIPSMRIKSASEFAAIVSSARPVILKNLKLGSCTQLWTNEYLKKHIGREHTVVVHQAASVHMDFVSKNFQYMKKPFGKFMEAIEKGEKLYLRSLSARKPTELSADLERDFPTIAADFRLPPELELVGENAHSSPLRISGPVNMWLHYDVMANVLCQVRGSKRLLLFPPSDVQYLNFSPGSSSSSMDVFNMLKDGEMTHTHPHEAILEPGDVLFLPALWLHAASPIDDVSIAVNVFFRNLKGGYAAGRDVYGNRDLQAYEQGRRDIARIAKSFESLPRDVRDFYLQRLADELRQAGDLK